MPNAATEAASSIPETAMTIVGIPLATPYPLVLNRKRHGTTTAGDTAPIIPLYLIEKIYIKYWYNFIKCII